MGGSAPFTTNFFMWGIKMEEWIDNVIHAVIETEFDEYTGTMRPVIVIGDKKLNWDEFGKVVKTFEGWKLDFKFSSVFIPPENDSD